MSYSYIHEFIIFQTFSLSWSILFVYLLVCLTVSFSICLFLFANCFAPMHMDSLSLFLVLVMQPTSRVWTRCSTNPITGKTWNYHRSRGIYYVKNYTTVVRGGGMVAWERWKMKVKWKCGNEGVIKMKKASLTW